MINVAVIGLLTHVSNIFSARSFLRVALKNNCTFICNAVSVYCVSYVLNECIR